jgi:peroxiredoxin Q/BCP
MALREGDKAPPFPLLARHAGAWVLVYFYPKDDTPGCTNEACALRDAFPDFASLDCAVIGVSADSETAHARFAGKHRLPFALLADTDKKVIKQYGAWQRKKFMGREYMGIARQSFLIDPRGVIQKVYTNVKPDAHAAEVLADLRTLKKQT